MPGPWFHITCKINKNKILIFSVYTLLIANHLTTNSTSCWPKQYTRQRRMAVIRPETADWCYKCCRNSDNITRLSSIPPWKGFLCILKCCTSCPILIHEKRCIIQSIPRLITVNTTRWTVENFVDVPSYRVVLNWRLFKTIAIYTLRS